MNGLTVMLIAFVALGFGYFIYSKWLEKTWGIDPKQPTPAVKMRAVTMRLLPSGRLPPTSSHPSRVPALSRDRLLPPCLAGFPRCSGC